jgi:hypothetical protein
LLQVANSSFQGCFHKTRSHQCPRQQDRREQAYDGEQASISWTLAAASGRLFISVHDPHSTKILEGQLFLESSNSLFIRALIRVNVI